MDQQSGQSTSENRTRRHLTDAFIVAFLGVQLLLPLRGVIWDKHETRADFTWNMYSKRYSCRVNYDVISEFGRRTRIDHRDFFYPRPSKTLKVFHRQSLPWFHEYVCERASSSRLGNVVHADVTCAINNGEHLRLVEPDTDICTAPNYGIIER